MSEHFAITLEQQQDYRFKASFDWDQAADLLVDSGEPLGQREGPDSERLLAVAVGYCLTASLLFSQSAQPGHRQASELMRLIRENLIEAHSWPMGASMHWLRDRVLGSRKALEPSGAV